MNDLRYYAMRLREAVKGFGVFLLIIYGGGAMLTPVARAILAHWECIQEEGWLGVWVFWCDFPGRGLFDDWLLKALLWPYFLWEWMTD